MSYEEEDVLHAATLSLRRHLPMRRKIHVI